MAKKKYTFKGKQYFVVYLNGFDKRGKRIQRRRKFDSSGNRISSLRKAEQIEFELKKELDGFKNNAAYWSWGEWLEECLKRMSLDLKKSTVEGYEGELKKWIPSFWQNKELKFFDKSEVHALIFEEIGHRASANRQKEILKKLKRVFEMAVEEGIITNNPCKGIKVKVPPPKQDVFNPKEAQKLLEEAKACRSRWYPLWATALFTGMRCGELYCLRTGDIDFDSGFIHVTKQFTSKDGVHPTKGNRNRLVPISDEIRPLLEELVKNGGNKEELWKWGPLDPKTKKETKVPVKWNDLLLPRLNEWKRGSQSKALRSFCRLAGITPVKFHDLRATFITNMLSHGEPLTRVMAIVGHNRLATTDTYNRLAGVNIKGSSVTGYKLPGSKKKESSKATLVLNALKQAPENVLEELADFLVKKGFTERLQT